MRKATNWRNKVKRHFFDIISFATPSARIFNLFSILFTLMIAPTNSLAYSPIKCIFKHFLLPLIFNGDCPVDGIFTNCNCPACGMTRGMSRLLHGDLTGAWNFNKMVFLVFFVMLFILIKDGITIYKSYRDKN